MTMDSHNQTCSDRPLCPPYQQRRGGLRPGVFLAVVSGWLGMTAGLLACVPPTPPAAPAPAAAAQPVVTGSLETIDGVRVLRVWGKPAERGYAHGYLLAEDIMAMVSEALLHPKYFPEVQAYESVVRERMIRLMAFQRDRRQELEGVLAGMKARLSEQQLQLPRVDRAVLLDDLVALNTFADWAGMLCSTFSVWDELTEGGETITARNLDYTPLPALRSRQLLIVRPESSATRKAWVTVAWPGVIGAYTAMNEDGVTISMHDVAQEHTPDRGRFIARACVLAEIMERASDADALEVAHEVMKAHAVACGNNIHVSVPFAGQGPAAAVYEYDSDRARGDGVMRRGPGEGDALASGYAMACTNHYRVRAAPTACERMDRIAEAVRTAAAAGRNIDAESARHIIASAANETTLHTVIFRPNAREFDVSFAGSTPTAAEGKVHRFRLADLFRRPAPAAEAPAAGN
jgi:hypothetical protein